MASRLGPACALRPGSHVARDHRVGGSKVLGRRIGWRRHGPIQTYSRTKITLTAVIALAAIGCCGLLYDISILLSRIHDGPVRDQRLAFLHKLRHGPQELQLPHKPPRHEKNADTDPDGEQHRDHCTAHPTDRDNPQGIVWQWLLQHRCNTGFLGNDLGTSAILPESRPAGQSSSLGPVSVESAFENDCLALITYAITRCLPPMKGIRISNFPGLIRSGVNRFEVRADVVSGRFAVPACTVEFNPIHVLPRFPQWWFRIHSRGGRLCHVRGFYLSKSAWRAVKISKTRYSSAVEVEFRGSAPTDALAPARSSI